MRSIRLSLIVYFLVLLGLALGAVSVLVYQITQQTLRAKEATTRDLLLAQYEERCRKERDALDTELLAQARTLATSAQIRYHSYRGRLQGINPVELLMASFSPNGQLLVPMWLGEGIRTPVTEHLRHLTLTEIQFDENSLATDVPMPEYFQINTVRGKFWPSQSLGDDRFPFDRDQFAEAKFFEPAFDDMTLPSSGASVRHVTLKVPVVRISFQVSTGRPPGPPREKPGPRPGDPIRVGPPVPPDSTEEPSKPPPERFVPRASTAILIHCASNTHERDEALAELRAGLDGSLADLEAQSADALRSLRNRLVLLSLATFAGTVVGGFFLVRHGLAPLRRLSDAVSRVSARDFRLPFDEPRLPGELRPIVERLNGTLELLKRAFAREKQAAADISHELRTPLAALLTTIELALRKTRTPAEYRELLEECHASGQQMNQLVEHLLTLARLDAGFDQLRRRPVDLAQLARQCATVVKPLAEARGLTLKVSCGEEADLTADPDKLREVLTNLLHNAIEYNRPQGWVELAVERENGHLQVEVRDSGIGIAPEACEHIFERFYRADPSRQADGLHAGLGLSIVKGYVDLMGGSIAVESEPGQGSTFRVRLPA